MTTLERIAQEASWVADTTSSEPWECRRINFVYQKAAKSERNKTIDEAIALIEKDFTYTTVVEKLNSLKI